MADSEFVTQGNLLTRGFLADAITKTAEWAAITDAERVALGTALITIFKAFRRSKTPNEAQTEDDLTWNVLDRLGGVDFLRQRNVAARGRDDVPDRLMFENATIKAQANAHHDEWHRYGVTDPDDIRYIYSTFPLVQKDEMDTHKRFLSQDLCLAGMNALLAGDPDANIKI